MTARQDAPLGAPDRKALRSILACALVVLSACGEASPGDGEEERSRVTERNVRFETSDGMTLTGRVFGRGRVGVTLAHTFPSDAESWYEPARELARAGYMALAFNFRGYATSEGPKQIAKAPMDVEAAATQLGRLGARDLTFVGASMGGTASIIASQSDEPLAVVAISAPTNFMGLDAPFVATDVQRPVLLMVSRGDAEAFESLDDLERALPNPDTKVYDGDAHGTQLLDDRPEAVDEIISFLTRYAPVSRTATPGT